MYLFEGEMNFGVKTHHFDVLSAQSFQITMSTVKTGFIYCFIYDANGHYRAGVVGQKSKKTLTIRPTDSWAAPGDEIVPGQWQVVLFNPNGEFRRDSAMRYQVQIEPLEVDKCGEYSGHRTLNTKRAVTFDIKRCLNAKAGWYKGDLHAHTVLSDGHNHMVDAVAIAHAQQLDFLFMTEHNLLDSRLPDSERCLFLPGFEVTTDLGHFNIHAPAKSLTIDKEHFQSTEMIAQGIEIASSANSSLSINHPMMKPWHWQYADMPLDAINSLEVCCDPTWSTSAQATESALKVLNAMWNAGYHIVAVGGSDNHLTPDERNPNATEPAIYGDPATYIYAQNLSCAALIKGLRQGRCYFARHSQIQFSLNDGALLPGDDCADAMVNIELSIGNTTAHYCAQLVVDGLCVQCVALGQQSVSLQWDMSHCKWLRVDIRQGLPAAPGELDALINPIYNGANMRQDTSGPKTWGQLQEIVASE